MKYCSKCNKVYPDDVECECIEKSKSNYFEKAEMKLVEDIEVKCECGSTEDLKFHPTRKSYVGDYKFKAYYQCLKCGNEIKARIAKYYILDDYRGEYTLCDSKDEVEGYLNDHYVKDSYYDRDAGELDDIIILKLEEVTGKIDKNSFLPTENTHLVLIDGEVFRVEEVIVPWIEIEGEYKVNW